MKAINKININYVFSSLPLSLEQKRLLIIFFTAKKAWALLIKEFSNPSWASIIRCFHSKYFAPLCHAMYLVFLLPCSRSICASFLKFNNNGEDSKNLFCKQNKLDNCCWRVKVKIFKRRKIFKLSESTVQQRNSFIRILKF